MTDAYDPAMQEQLGLEGDFGRAGFPANLRDLDRIIAGVVLEIDLSPAPHDYVEDETGYYCLRCFDQPGIVSEEELDKEAECVPFVLKYSSNLGAASAILQGFYFVRISRDAHETREWTVYLGKFFGPGAWFKHWSLPYAICRAALGTRGLVWCGLEPARPPDEDDEEPSDD